MIAATTFARLVLAQLPRNWPGAPAAFIRQAAVRQLVETARHNASVARTERESRWWNVTARELERHEEAPSWPI